MILVNKCEMRIGQSHNKSWERFINLVWSAVKKKLTENIRTPVNKKNKTPMLFFKIVN